MVFHYSEYTLFKIHVHKNVLLTFPFVLFYFEHEHSYFKPQRFESLLEINYPFFSMFMSKIEKKTTKRVGANLVEKGPKKDHEILAKQHLVTCLKNTQSLKSHVPKPNPFLGPENTIEQ